MASVSEHYAELSDELREIERTIDVDPQQSLERASRLLVRSRKSSQASIVAWNYLVLQRALVELLEFRRAKAMLTKAERWSRECASEPERSKWLSIVLWRRAMMLYDENRIADAIRLLDQAVEHSAHDPYATSKYRLELALLHSSNGHYDKMIELCYSVLTTLQAVEQAELLRLVAHIRLADAHSIIHNVASAKEHVAKAMALLDQGHGHKSIRCAAITILGSIAEAEHRNGEALDHYRECLDLLGEHNQVPHQVELQCKIARLLQADGDARRALDALNRAQELAAAISHPMTHFRMNCAFAEYHFREGKFADAFARYQKAEDLRQGYYPEFGAELYFRLSEVHEHLDDPRQAHLAYQRAVELTHLYSGANVQQKAARSEFHYALQAEVVRRKEELVRANNWEEFSRSFEMYHPEFFKRLFERAPDLTATEIRICALLRFNLSSKEIARIASMSIHTANTHRRHLRKKFKLPEDQSLIHYLITI